MLNGIVSHQDWLPTLLAAAGEPDIKEKLLEGHTAGDKTFKVHIDGYNMLPYLTGEVAGEPAERLLLHQRRRRHHGDPDGRLEGRADGAAGEDSCCAGSSRSCSCGRPRSSTCAATRSSGPTRTRTPTGTG